MKQKTLLKTALLLLALAGGTNTAWADDYQEWPLVGEPTTYLDMSKAIITNSYPHKTADASAESGYKIDWIPSNNSENKAQNYVEFNVHNSTENYYVIKFFLSYANNSANEAKVTVKVTDVATSTVELNQTLTFNSGDDNKTGYLFKPITEGNKVLRFEFNNNSSGCNFKNVTFQAFNPATEFDAWPLESASTYLDLGSGSATTTSKPRYHAADGGNPSYIDWVSEGSSVDNFFVNNTNASCYYTFKAICSYRSGSPQLKITITDMNDDTEFSETFTLGSSDAQSFEMTHKVTPGLKKIRFDWPVGESRLSQVTFAVNKYSLDDNEDYAPSAVNGVNVELKRSIAANAWSTICLPFAMTNAQLKSAFGEDVKVAELTSGDNTTLTFTSVTETAANKPYAIKVSSNFTEATITGVDIVSATPKQTITNWDFVGTYSKTTIGAGNYYFKSNQLYKAGTGTHNIKPFRAYLEYTGAGGAPAPMLNLMIDGETTAIGTIKADGTMRTLDEGTVFSLSGQRVAKPSKGVYIVNGKKVIFK